MSPPPDDEPFIDPAGLRSESLHQPGPDGCKCEVLLRYAPTPITDRDALADEMARMDISATLPE